MDVLNTVIASIIFVVVLKFLFDMWSTGGDRARLKAYEIQKDVEDHKKRMDALSLSELVDNANKRDGEDRDTPKG